MKQALLSRSLLLLLSMLLLASIFLSFLFDEYRFYTGMGSDAAIAPQDSGIAVSYHINGSTYLYTANMDGSHAARVTNAASADETNPVFSPDGEELLFLDETKEQIQSLFTDRLGESAQRLTGDDLHIRDAVFSPNGTTIYAIGIPTEDWMAEDSTSAGGFDIYAIERGSGETEKITNNDYFIMSHLSISPQGEYLLFNITEENKEEIRTYPLSETSDIPASYKQFPTGIYGAVLAPDGQQVAYSAISNTAAAEKTNQYDLFLFNNETGQSERLTADSSNIESPSFYHKSNQVMYVEDENWPDQPESYKLRSMDLADKEATTIELDVPNHSQQRWLSSTALFLMNPTTTLILYALLGGFAAFKLRRFPKAIFLPACGSALLSGAAYGMNYFYPWTYQDIVIALGPPAFSLLLCAGLFWLLGFSLRKLPNKKNRG
ncbi:TolB family protein [Salibacterium aidingense]|uniref:TolB family protein n=1 Tax=Salibacterium aidingense TaxID=384933 RepID=UPI003BC198BD